mmetsp:Transcript_3949/g.7761  ORF Transcript_3949/g.7761 Transcript_3949/m.7761 type:complete len:239 (+) Transcript_3949:130-846(+)
MHHLRPLSPIISNLSRVKRSILRDFTTRGGLPLSSSFVGRLCSGGETSISSRLELCRISSWVLSSELCSGRFKTIHNLSLVFSTSPYSSFQWEQCSRWRHRLMFVEHFISNRMPISFLRRPLLLAAHVPLFRQVSLTHCFMVPLFIGSLGWPTTKGQAWQTSLCFCSLCWSRRIHQGSCSPFSVPSSKTGPRRRPACRSQSSSWSYSRALLYSRTSSRTTGYGHTGSTSSPGCYVPCW